MLSMIANPVTALPVGYPRSGLSRSDLVPWALSDGFRGSLFRQQSEQSGHRWMGR
jgi:hypothetical protein